METCLSEPSLRQFAAGTLNDAERNRLLLHAHRCAACHARLEAAASPSDRQTLLAQMEQAATASFNAGTAPDRSPESVSFAVNPADLDCPGIGSPQEPGELGRLGSFRLLEVLGQGGMGLVFRAEDMQLKRHVAIKVMPVLWEPMTSITSDSCARPARRQPLRTIMSSPSTTSARTTASPTLPCRCCWA